MFTKTEAITMQLSGVHDTATKKAATQCLRHINGVKSVSVQGAVATVTYLPEKTTVPTLTKALSDAGFRVI